MFSEKNEREHIEVCSDEVSLNLGYKITALALSDFGPVTVENLRVHLSTQEKAKDEPFQLPDFSRLHLPRFLKGTNVQPLKVTLAKASYINPTRHYEAKGTLSFSEEGSKFNTVQLNAEVNDVLKKQQYTANVEVKSEDFFVSDQWKINVQSEFAEEEKEIKAQFNFLWDRRDKYFELLTTAKMQKIKANAVIKTHYEKDEMVTSVEAKVDNIDPMIPHVELPHCEFSLRAVRLTRNDGILNINCPLHLQLKEYSFLLEGKKVDESPKTAVLDLSGEVETFFELDLDHETKGTITAKMLAMPYHFIETDGNISVQFEGIPTNFPDDWKLLTDFDFNFSIKHFQKLAQFLSNTTFSLPAPFHVLKGDLALNIKGKSDVFGDDSHFPFQFQTHLSSSEQNFDVLSDGNIRINFSSGKYQSSYLEMKVKLDDVEVQLPKLNPIALPQLVLDERIVLEKQKKVQAEAEKKTFTYDVFVVTEKSQPLQVKYYPAKKTIPILVDLHLSDKGMEGTVHIQTFPVEFFQREATVEQVSLRFLQPTENSEVDATINVPYADYTITIKVLGTLDQPKVVMESSPPLSEEDIYAVLLYGEPYQELAYDESSSTADVSAAIADRALSLFSLYALGSTPIERVNYNPVTKSFSTKIKLPGGASLVLGGDAEKKEIGIQKQLGKGWIIRTLYESPNEENAQQDAKATAVIEWNKRY